MKNIQNFKYEVDELNVVRIWNEDVPNEDNAPFILQPSFPDGTAWNAEQAEEWAVNFINNLLGV